MNETPRHGPSFLALAAGVYCLTLVVLWLARHALETTWVGALVLLGPPICYLLPIVLLTPVALVRRRPGTLAVLTTATLFVLFTWMGLRLSGTRSARADLRVLTYNVYGGRMGIPRILEALQKADPDVCILQECHAAPGSLDPYPELERAFPDWHWVRAAHQRELVVGSRFPLTNAEEFSLGGLRPGFRCKANTPGGALAVYDVHLSTSYKGNLWSSGWGVPAYLHKTMLIRQRQYLELAAELKREEGPVIVGGDFNTTPACSGPELLSEFLTDTFATVGNGFGFTYSYRYPVLRIDYLYCAPSLRPLHCSSYDGGASDHRGLLADFVWASEHSPKKLP